MHKLKIFLVLTLLVFVQVSCNTTDPKLEPELLLKLEDVSCTEAWLQLSTNNIQLPITINLLKNNSVTQTFSLSTKDSLLYIDSLLPNQNYSFQVSSILYQVSSNKLAATTIDTTSHNFTWQTFEFGQHSSSVLYDVAIIDENNIWAVGEIFMNDSLGNPDPTCYNAVHWNGQSWELKKIGGIGGWACHTIFAFSTNDIWFEGTIHWNGANYTVHKNGWPLMPNGDGWQVNKMWGSGSNDLYAVGNAGNIARYNGSNWTKIESGTTISLNDAYGSPEGKTLWISGYDSDTGRSLLLRYSDNSITKIYEVSPGAPGWNEARRGKISGVISSVWTKSFYHLWLASSFGFYKTLQNTNGEGILNYKFSFPIGFIERLRGEADNNIFAVGHYSTIFHYNGLSWALAMISFGDGVKLYSVATKNNDVLAVGTTGKAIIIKGKQIN